MATAAPELPVLSRDQAFEALYRRYVKDVYHYALALLRNPADAEDVTQTTFLNAYRAYTRGIQVEKPQNWLIKIAHNVARSRYARAGRRVKEVPLEDHVEQLALPEEDRPDVRGVLNALGGLPFNQRAALVMRELEGRSYAEIADTIGVSVSAVETLIFRARKSLRLKASALRSLAAVPLPSSLAQFFDTGGVVVGGSAVAGGGFLAKALVALVAGALATGVGGDRSGPAAAASDRGTAPTGSWTIDRGQMARGLQMPPISGGVAAEQGGWTSVTKKARRGGRVTGLFGTVSEASPAASAQSASGPGAPSSTAGKLGGPTAPVSAPVSQVADTVSTVAGTVQQTVQVPAVPAVTVPVSPPALPPVPPPPVPGGPPLP